MNKDLSDIALKVEGLWKQYRLGLVGAKTLKDDLQRFYAALRGRENPLEKIGSTNQLNQINGDHVWALQDISFEVKKGEVLGIIGKNGAGKSTLLKILSKVAGPTKGKIYVDGRVASLLEVGTGFHPELTGRENIFLNGAILGMKKWEIKSKLEEIIGFAGVEKYLDTPVKRYSSGMYVRLAFAVAAHLEPEILIVDEVLAVGDVEFQRKALGKMQDVSRGDGRTVLFVSHNMDAIHRICNKGLLLKEGIIDIIGTTQNVIDRYNESSIVNFGEKKLKVLNKKGGIISIRIFDKNSPKKEPTVGNTIVVKLKLEILDRIKHGIIAIGIKKEFISLRTSWTKEQDFEPGEYTIEFTINDIIYSEGNYSFTFGFSSYENSIQYLEDVYSISISRGVANLDKRILRTKNTSIELNPIPYKIHQN